MIKLKHEDVPKYTQESGMYCVNIQLKDVENWISDLKENEGLQLNPDFQRGRVWTEEQQIKFIEFLFRGGKSDPIKLNKPSWNCYSNVIDNYDEMVCVDGLQRLTAIIKFYNKEIKAFGYYYDEIEYSCSLKYDIRIAINDLRTRKEVLNWYLELNDGGTVHTKEELDKVRKLLKKC